MFIYSTTKDGMCKWITSCFNFPASVNETMRTLCSNDRVQHNAIITAGRVFHAGRHIHTTDGKAMLLIFNRTGTDSYIRENVGKITIVFRIKHFICAGESAFLNCVNMHFTNGNQPGKHIGCFFRIWLMNHTFVSFTCSTWLIGINSWNDQNFVCNFILHFTQTKKIITNSIFVIGRTWTDDCKKFIRFACKDITDLLISFCFQFLNCSIDGILVADLGRCRQFL